VTLADCIVVLLLERGPLSACAIAVEVRRRKTDVLALLRADHRFVREGKGRSTRWSLAPVPSLDVQETAVRWECSVEMATEILVGPEGFVEKGFVANGDGRFRVTRLGLAAAALLEWT
jgi:hypothetical protein